MATDVPAVQRSIPAVVALANSVMGTRWPNPWWPTGTSIYDDCAAFVSWLLWGLRPNGQPWETIVSGIIERSGMIRRTDIANMRQGDLVGMEWGGDDNYDHIEWFDGWISPGYSYRTLGTNAGPGDNVAVRTRYVSDVKAFARPNYPGLASLGERPLGEEDMGIRYRISANSTDGLYKTWDGWVLDDLNSPFRKVATGPGGSVDWTLADALGYRMIDISGNDFAKLVAGHTFTSVEIGDVSVDNTAVLKKLETLPTAAGLTAALNAAGTSIIAGVKAIFGKAAS